MISRVAPMSVLFVLVGLSVSGCSSNRTAGFATQKVPSAVQFPSVRYTDLKTFTKSFGSGPEFAPSGQVFQVGSNRLGFALFDREHRPIENAQVALYTASLDGKHLAGPFPADYEPLGLRPAFISRTTDADKDGGKGLYVATVNFMRGGKHGVFALVQQGNGFVVSTGITTPVDYTNTRSASAGHKNGPPQVGDRAPKIHTSSIAAVSDRVSICTRDPIDSMHRDDFAGMLGHRPIVIVFATPQLCQSRVCGPVVDIAEQVKARHGAKVTFIHHEIYRNNRPSDGFRPELSAWRLPSEPWTFVVDRKGQISARFEGALSVAELERAVQKVL